MMLPKLTIVFALMGATLVPCAAFAQDGFISVGGESSFDRNFNDFHGRLDDIAEGMSRSYDRRKLAAAQSHVMHADAAKDNQLAEQIFHQRGLDNFVLSKNPLDQSAYNQGNNQANNGYMPGSFQGGSLLSNGLNGDSGDLAGTFGTSSSFPGLFGARPFPGSRIRPGAGNSFTTLTRSGTNGFNGSITDQSTGNIVRSGSTRTFIGSQSTDVRRRGGTRSNSGGGVTGGGSSGPNM